MKRNYRHLLLFVIAASVAALAYNFYAKPKGPTTQSDNLHSISRLPRIHPDYSGTVIPPNIAPLNFLIREEGRRYCVRVYSQNGRRIEVNTRSGKIVIPQRHWRRLLEANPGQQLNFDVFVRDDNNRWNRYKTVTNTIAPEPIDGYLVYRRIHPGCSAWKRIGIYQRKLADFDESLVLDNRYFAQGCLNCHAFCNNKTDKMLIGIRSAKYGSSALLVEDGRASKIGTKFGYTAWHPSGRLAAYSVNHVIQFFHSGQNEVRDVLDLNSLIAYYRLDTGKAKTCPQLSKKERLETYPTWSPDGRYLYFSSAPLTWSRTDIVPPHYSEIKYDLLRISYDLETDRWGELETVLSARDTGLSALLPRISPDGRRLLFCMCDYGCFPVYRAASDLYMIDLEAPETDKGRKYRRLDINSDQSESWHSWSSNSRWIAFSSKMGNGTFTRPYLAYVDREGTVYKPLVVPQKDPAHYDGCLWTYSVPELVTEPVEVTKEKLGRVVRSSEKVTADFPVTRATPKAATSSQHVSPWQTERE